MTDFTLRAETPEDRATVATMLAQTYGAEGVKAIELVSQLRDHENFDETLALIAEENKTATASAMLLPIEVEGKSAVVLASLAFKTKETSMVPTDMLAKVVETAKAAGKSMVLMRGIAADFAAQGFQPATGLTFTNSKEADWLVYSFEGEVAGAVTLPDVLVKS